MNITNHVKLKFYFLLIAEIWILPEPWRFRRHLPCSKCHRQICCTRWWIRWPLPQSRCISAWTKKKKKFSKIWTYFKFSVYYLYFCRMMSLFDQILQNINEEIKILGEKDAITNVGQHFREHDFRMKFRKNNSN